jgi:hypothetical protein
MAHHGAAARELLTVAEEPLFFVIEIAYEPTSCLKYME